MSSRQILNTLDFFSIPSLIMAYSVIHIKKQEDCLQDISKLDYYVVVSYF